MKSVQMFAQPIFYPFSLLSVALKDELKGFNNILQECAQHPYNTNSVITYEFP